MVHYNCDCPIVFACGGLSHLFNKSGHSSVFTVRFSRIILNSGRLCPPFLVTSPLKIPAPLTGGVTQVLLIFQAPRLCDWGYHLLCNIKVVINWFLQVVLYSNLGQYSVPLFSFFLSAIEVHHVPPPLCSQTTFRGGVENQRERERER